MERPRRPNYYAFSLAGDLGDGKLFYGGTVRYSRGETKLASTSLFGLGGFGPSDAIDLAKDGLSTRGTAASP